MNSQARTPALRWQCPDATVSQCHVTMSLPAPAFLLITPRPGDIAPRITRWGIMLTCIIALPLFAAVVLAFVPRTFAVVMRGVAILSTLVSALLALLVFLSFQVGSTAYQFERQIPWVQSLGI